MKIAAVGEAMIELAAQGDTAGIGVAGDTLNTAIYLKRGAPHLEVDYITRLGSDPFSERIAAFIAAEGIGTAAIERDTVRTCGLYAITTDADGERSFSYWRSAAAARHVFETSDGPCFDVLGGYDAIYVSGISLAVLMPRTRAALLRWLSDWGGTLIFDSNHRPALWPDAETARDTVLRMWEMCTYALPSQDDEAELFDEPLDAVAARFLALGKRGALKRGERGPLCLETGAEHAFAPAQSVVDTTAAGDSFNGGYLAAVLSGRDQHEALQQGHALASQVVGHRGAILPKGGAG